MLLNMCMCQTDLDPRPDAVFKVGYIYHTSLGLLLDTEARVMMSNGVDFSLSFSTTTLTWCPRLGAAP